MYILLKTNIYHIFFYSFLLCESPDVMLLFFLFCFLLLQNIWSNSLVILSFFIFFFGTTLCYGNLALEEKMGQKKIKIKKINFKSPDTVPCIKLK